MRLKFKPGWSVPLPDRKTGVRAAFVATAVSFLVWSGWVVLHHHTHPFCDLANGIFTDHISHMNVARLFPQAGTGIWKSTVHRMYRPYLSSEAAKVPEDVRAGGSFTGGIYKVPGWGDDKPFVASWTRQPRIYPPGDILLFAPFAALYHFTGISARGINKALIVYSVALAHIGIFMLLLMWFGGRLGRGPAGVAILCVSYSLSLEWSLNGFYDMAAFVPLVLCGAYLGQRRGLAAATAYITAAFVHFRTFFLAPMAVYAAWIVIGKREWRGWNWRSFCALAASASMAAASLAVFFTVLPSVREAGVECPLNIWSRGADRWGILLFSSIWLLAAAGFSRERAWLDLAVLIWLWIVVTSLHQNHQWHVLAPMAWLAMPVISGKKGDGDYVRWIRLGVFCFMASFAFKNALIPYWLQDLFR